MNCYTLFRTLNIVLAGFGISGMLAATAIASDVSCITPDLLGTVSLGGEITDSVVVDSLLYTTNRPGGLHIYDVADPAFPVLLGSYLLSGVPQEVTVVDDIAYIAYGIVGLVIVDVSDPTNPTLMSRMGIGGSARDVAVVGDTAYIAAEEGGLKIVDVSDPFAMQIIATVPTQGDAKSVIAQGPTLYLTERVDVQNARLLTFDISKPASPTQLGVYDFDVGHVSAFFDESLTVVLLNNTAIIPNGNRGTYLIDVSDPASPSFVTRIIGNVSEVSLDGTTFYATYFFKGISVFDLSVPNTAVSIGRTFNSSIDWSSLWVSNGVGFAGTVDDGIRAYDMRLTLNCDCQCFGADFTGDCRLNFFDVTLFLQAYTSNDPIADLNGDGVFDFKDVSSFLTGYSAGCLFFDPSE